MFALDANWQKALQFATVILDKVFIFPLQLGIFGCVSGA